MFFIPLSSPPAVTGFTSGGSCVSEPLMEQLAVMGVVRHVHEGRIGDILAVCPHNGAFKACLRP